MTSVKSLPFILCLTLLGVGVARAQNNLSIYAEPFEVQSNDADAKLYSSLAVKLPGFFCNGILNNSSLHLEGMVTKKELFNRDLTPGVDNSYIMKGRISIYNGYFSVDVRIYNDNKREVLFYKSRSLPLQDFQKVVDGACENLNFQIKNLLAGNRVPVVTIRSFKVVNTALTGNARPVHKDDQNTDFPAKYISENLSSPHNEYLVAPIESSLFYEYAIKDTSLFVAKDNFIIGGNTFYHGSLLIGIQPIIYQRSDSIALDTIRGSADDRAQLLGESIDGINGILSNITRFGDIKHFQEALLSPNEQKCDSVFDDAIHSKNWSLAHYFARCLEINSNNKVKWGLNFGRLYIAESKYLEAVKQFKGYLKGTDSVVNLAKYYLGLSFLNAGYYDSALQWFNKIPKEMFNDLQYNIGMCYFHQDSVNRALVAFKSQNSNNPNAHLDVNLYISKCYSILKNYRAAEDYMVLYYEADTNSYTTAIRLGEFYFDRAKAFFDSSDFRSSYNYYQLAYKYIKGNSSLLGATEALLSMRVSDSTIKIELAKFEDSTGQVTDFGEDYYLDLGNFAQTLTLGSSYNIDKYYANNAIFFYKRVLEKEGGGDKYIYQSIGVDYFELGNLDSALCYYSKVISSRSATPADYFNLAEAQVINWKLDLALLTLDSAYNAFSESNPKKLNPFNESEMSIYLFYKIQVKMLLDSNTVRESAQLKEILEAQRDAKGALFDTWRFLTFYNWVSGTDKIGEPKRRNLLDNICFINRYFRNNKLPCAVN
jgi:hypothetical protein